MDIIEKITLDMLTQNSVSILKQKFIEIDGEETQVGNNVRNAYMNCVSDRTLIETLLPEDYYNAVIAVWGDAPTVDEPTADK